MGRVSRAKAFLDTLYIHYGLGKGSDQETKTMHLRINCEGARAGCPVGGYQIENGGKTDCS